MNLQVVQRAQGSLIFVQELAEKLVKIAACCYFGLAELDKLHPCHRSMY